MVDSLGTTRYTYDAAGQLLTEDGPFTSDTVTNTYSNRRRVGLSLQQPTGRLDQRLWLGPGWPADQRDLAGGCVRLQPTRPLDADYSGRLVQQLGLPSGATITNLYDPVARLLGTVLGSSGGTTLDAAYYGYNQGNQRTASTNAAGAYVQYTYDPIGQLTIANSVHQQRRPGLCLRYGLESPLPDQQRLRKGVRRGQPERADRCRWPRSLDLRCQRQSVTAPGRTSGRDQLEFPL